MPLPDALSSMMKMHSYCAHNGMLSSIYFNMKDEEKRLAALLETFPDDGEAIRKEAERKAQAHVRREKEAERTRTSSNGSPSTSRENSPSGSRSDIPVGTPNVPTGSSSFTTGYLSQGDLLKLKLAPEVLSGLAGDVSSGTRARHAANQRSDSPAPNPLLQTNNVDPKTSQVPLGTSLEPAHMGQARVQRQPSALTFATDERVATLAKNIDTMRDELTSHGSDGIVWPANIGYKSYWEFMCMPTLCYQLWYPRTTT